jgi:SAM-dependent methyltransferase
MKRELLIGCGSERTKRLTCDGSKEWSNLTTLDYNPDHKPDVVWDLMQGALPFEDNSFDEIHAYEVLEHTGTQGDYKFFFRQFSDFWRVLKPNGHFLATCPSKTSVWALGDPSHTRILVKENLVFLNQDAYADVGVTPISDFRSIYKADFKPVYVDEGEERFHFVLKAIKGGT